MQVLGVQHDEQEDQHDRDVGEQRERLDPHVGGVTQRGHDPAHELGEECAVAVGQRVGVDRGAADQRVGPDDVEDHEQDQPRAAGVGTVEAGLAAQLLGLTGDADDREGDDAEQHGHGEEVLQEAQGVPAADERDVEVVVEQQAERLEVDRRQDEEAPHREEVGDAGDRPFQQPGLPEDLFELRGDPLAQVVLAVVGLAHRLARPDEFRQPQHSLDRENAHDRGHQDPDDDPDQHLRIHTRLRFRGYPSVT